MDIAVLGTGMVGQAVAGRLHELGHTVVIGTRDPQATRTRTEPDVTGSSFSAWADAHPEVALATFADAARRRRARRERRLGRCHPRRARAGGRRRPGRQGAGRHLQPARLLGRLPAHPVGQGHRLARRAGPARLPRRPGGEDPEHPHRVAHGRAEGPRGLQHRLRVRRRRRREGHGGRAAQSFGHDDVIDLGGIETARGAELFLPLWLRLMGSLGTHLFNVKVVR